ncbi:MAG: hypothetical protein QOH39_2889 [Verrucomicrobiota bacterium]
MSDSNERPPPGAGSGSPGPIDEEALLREVIRLSRNVLGLTLGVLFAIVLFIATNILVLKDGPNVGAHLQLLNQFFPGYAVTFAGSFLGLLYGFLVGYISGWVIATVYNWVVLLRRP